MAGEIPDGNTGQTLPALLMASVALHPERPALWRFVDARWEAVTYGALAAAAAHIARRLAEHGIGPEQRIAIAITDRSSWGVTYLGVIFSGATAVPIEPLLKPPEIGAILHDADVALIIHDGRIDLGKHAGAHQIVTLNSIWPDIAAGEGESEITLPSVTADALATIIFTSGTTGRTKGVMLSHGNLVGDILGVDAMGLLSGSDILLSVLPIHHAFEFTAGFLYPLAIGAQVAYARSLKSRDIIADLGANRATVILAVPLLFENIVNSIRAKVQASGVAKRRTFNMLLALSRKARGMGWRGAGRFFFKSMRRKAGLDTLRILVSGGAALPPFVAEYCDTIGLPLVQGYGLTETSPVATVNRPTAYRYDTVGPPVPTAEVQIIDPRPDGIGEIAIRGPMVMKGYWRQPEETAKVMRDGWLLTGDLGMIDPDGHLRICGRSKNLIVTGAGKNVYPEEVEAVLCARPEIAEAVVYGQARPGKIGETVAAVVVPDADWFENNHPVVWDDDQALQAALTETVKTACESLASFKRVADVKVQREPFEKTSTRKIKRFLVTHKQGERYSSPFASPPAGTHNHG